jgi:hypothetical protein
MESENQRLTSGLLQGWQDIGAMVILSLLCFIWAGPTLLGFCLLACTFISLISSGSGRTSNEFQPCSKPCPLGVMLKHTLNHQDTFETLLHFKVTKYSPPLKYLY